MKYRYKYKRPVEGPDYAKDLLKLRGIKDVDSYITPSIDQVQSYLDLDNIEKGVELVAAQIEDPESRIALICDSDIDGMTSAAMMYLYLKQLNPKQDIDYWLHPGKQHGLESHINMLEINNQGYTLIITPDASSNDYDYHERLKRIGLPVLVIDHHLADGPFSDNAVIINNQLSENYKNKALTGAGVVWQFCRALDDYFNVNYAKNYLDLAAVGIIGDMGSILEPETRYIISQGLKHPSSNPFITAIYKSRAYSITGNSAASDEEIHDALNPIVIAFYVAPLVNAMIRHGKPEEKERMFRAFIAGDEFIPSNKRGAKGEMVPAAEESVRECSNARSRQNKERDRVIDMLSAKIEAQNLLDNEILLVKLDEEKFPSELNGLVAMMLTKKYSKPTIVARLGKDGYVKGSARGINGSALTSFKDYMEETGLFEYAQGHDNALGISIPESAIPTLHAQANKDLADIDFGEGIHFVDFVVDGADDFGQIILDLEAYNELWGVDNPKPLFAIEIQNLDMGLFYTMGQKNDTLGLRHNGVAYVRFKDADLVERIQGVEADIAKVTIIGRSNVNTWNGITTPQIIIEEIEIEEYDRFAF